MFIILQNIKIKLNAKNILKKLKLKNYGIKKMFFAYLYLNFFSIYIIIFY